MNSVFFYGYTTAGIGVLISLVYFGLFSIVQQRHLRMVMENAVVQLYESRRNQMIVRKNRNRYRMRLITRRLLNKINQLRSRVHLQSEMPQWKLIYTSTGDLRAIPLPS